MHDVKQRYRVHTLVSSRDSVTVVLVHRDPGSRSDERVDPGYVQIGTQSENECGKASITGTNIEDGRTWRQQPRGVFGKDPYAT
jgi:hypothetical protein